MKRNFSLDVARGLLAWAIVGVHCVWLTGHGGPIQHQVGVWTVIAFVAMSGYVIALSLSRRQEPYLDFLWRRLSRLLPVFLACLALSLALRPWTIGSAPAEAIRELYETRYYPAQICAHLSLLYGAIPDTLLPGTAEAFLPPAWCITLEFQLYLLAPLALYILRKDKWTVTTLVMLASGLLLFRPFSGPLAHYWGETGAFFLQRLFFFLLGMLFAVYPAWGTVFRFADKIRYPSFLRYLGALSYSVFLVHWPILACLNSLFSSIRDDMPVDLYATLLFASGTPFILLGAVLLYEYVEKPGNTLGCLLINRRSAALEPS